MLDGNKMRCRIDLQEIKSSSSASCEMATTLHIFHIAYVSTRFHWHSILPLHHFLFCFLSHRIDNDGHDLLSMLLQVKAHRCIQMFISRNLDKLCGRITTMSPSSPLCVSSLRLRSVCRLRMLSDIHILEVLESRFKHWQTVSTYNLFSWTVTLVKHTCLTNPLFLF